MRVPLAVRIETSTADRMLQGEIEGLSFRKVANGGDASARFRLRRPLGLVAPEIETYAPVSIINTQTGYGVWHGRQADPGRSAGDQGELYEVTCEGPSAFLRDRTMSLAYIDAELGAWEKFGGSVSSGTVQGDENAAGTADVLRIQFQPGAGVITGNYVAARNLRIHSAGLHLASVSYTVVGGGNSPAWRMQAHAYPSETELMDEDLSTGGIGATLTLDDWDFPDDTWVNIRIYREGADSTPDGGARLEVGDLVVQSTRYTEYGTEITSGSEYNQASVYAWQVVADVLGRFGQTYFDGADAFIDETGTHEITQLVYPQGATGAQVLDDIAELEPGFTWRAFQRLDNGKYRFEYRPKPTTIRYEVDVYDGLGAQGDSLDLYNECIVRWIDARGRRRVRTVTADVPALTARGLTRSVPLDLGTFTGSTTNAIRAGQEFLAAHSTPSSASQLTISRAILDVEHGRTVQPWEIEPDNLILVRGVNPRPDALTATGRDGNTVYYIAAMEFDAGTCSAVLDLDAPSVTTGRQLAEIRGRLDKAAV